MNPLLEQFLSEARDFLQGISEKLLQLETNPADTALMSELFRLVHTLKGNCGLFDFPEMLRVLHVAEDLMAVVRDGDLAYSQLLADRLLDAMDFVSMLLDEIESDGSTSAAHAGVSSELAQSLRQLISKASVDADDDVANEATSKSSVVSPQLLTKVTEEQRMGWYSADAALTWISYTPEAECFFKGEDPFYHARQTPGLVWQTVCASTPWAPMDSLDAYQCNLTFHLITTATRAEIDEHYRYIPEQIEMAQLAPMMLALPVGDENGGPVYEDFINDALAHVDSGNLAALERAAYSMLELSSAGLWLASALRWLLLILRHEPVNQLALRAVLESLRTFAAPDWHSVVPQISRLTSTVIAAAEAEAAPALAAQSAPSISMNSAQQALIDAQLMVLRMSDDVSWLTGRLKAVGSTLHGYFRSIGKEAVLPELDAALTESIEQARSAPLLTWLEQYLAPTPEANSSMAESGAQDTPDLETSGTAAGLEGEQKFARRSDDAGTGAKTLKVDQEKIDRLMNLIGEMVVAKNGLPYLATRAEAVFGVRELAREIKAQYAVINRIAEEMQDAIMQVRMMPVSFVFQRFPRLVRDISRKLGKEVQLVLEGEETEADKNIIEALADPLIHIVRNSLDHGFETPDVRRAAGKLAEGRLLIRASQEAGRVIIDISDDGKGIDPDIIKRKAFEKGIIDQATLERISDQDAVNLVFAAGFSTAEVVSDLSGRGVGMDVVRSAVEQANGTVTLESTLGQGTNMRLSLPLSMAVTNVMIIESAGQIFGVPMDMVVETVRIPRASIHTIKSHQTAVLRGQIVPLRSLNDLLATNQVQLSNEEDELATLVIRIQGEPVGIVVDDFREVVDIILKPMNGILGSLPGYAGSALLGDGSVLMVLNLKEMV